MVRQLKLKNQGPYTQRVDALGKTFSFTQGTGCVLSDHPAMDKYYEALLSVPGVESVQGSQPAPGAVGPKPTQPKGPSPEGATVKVSEPAQPKEQATENKNPVGN